MSEIWKKLNWVHVLGLFALSIVLFVGYLYIYTSVLNLELPKTRYLRHQNQNLMLKCSVLERRVESYSQALEALEVRDEDIYRSIFGLNSIPSSVRNEGMPGDKRYEELNMADNGFRVMQLAAMSDKVTKRAYVQSKSLDEIEMMLNSADLMALSMPTIWPVVPDQSKVHISSRFGSRSHPLLGYVRPHQGIDISVKKGTEIYVTGDGVVEKVEYERSGYGHYVIIDHGFGYKTLYAHCKSILVAEGIKVKRGEQIAESGNTGISSGPHVHYEIRYKGKAVNPLHYFDQDMPVQQYRDLVQKAAENSEKFYVHPSHLK